LIHFRRKVYPVLIIVDDGGLSYVDPDNSSPEVTFDAYVNIVRLAKEFKIRIPVCFTMQYLDIHNVSGYGRPVSYAKELINLLCDNQAYIEVGYHGLTHDFVKNHVGEFYLLDIHSTVPEEVQQEHIYKSRLIYKDLGWDFPKLFVPPAHAWEMGITDKILAQYGVKYLVSVQNLKYAGYTYKWAKSQYLTFLPREGLGVWSFHTYLPPSMVETVKSCLLPRSTINNLRVSGRLFSRPVHSYMTHIGNFMNGNYEFWQRFFQYVEQSPQYELARNNEDAVNKYLCQ
jgi:hypothetical protein